LTQIRVWLLIIEGNQNMFKKKYVGGAVTPKHLPAGMM
jgi:hypothetical protein